MNQENKPAQFTLQLGTKISISQEGREIRYMVTSIDHETEVELTPYMNDSFITIRKLKNNGNT